MSYTQTQAEKCGFSRSNSRSVASRIVDDTFSNLPCSHPFLTSYHHHLLVMALSSRTDPYDLYDTLEDNAMACDPPAPVPALPAGQPARARKPSRAPSGGAVDLSVFDILNTFRRRWFLSRDALLANVLSAQKAEDGLVSWVEFAPDEQHVLTSGEVTGLS